MSIELLIAVRVWDGIVEVFVYSLHVLSLIKARGMMPQRQGRRGGTSAVGV